jgi:CubicO group peptidase (beta-lactamase class C family)
MAYRVQRREFLLKSTQAALGFSLLPATARTQTHPSNDNLPALIADLEKQLPSLMQETTVPGLSIVLIKNAKVSWHREFGFTDSASKKPVDQNTMFEAASMSKPVFAYAVMKLCEKGVMNLDTPLTKYTPERLIEGDPRLDLITARHILSHTSGFQNWRSDKEPLAIHFTPGEKYLYSGEGYSYLESVVTHLTGQPFEAFIRANILVPFGMNSSCYVWDTRAEKHMAHPHDKQGKPSDNKKSTSADVARYGSAGALLTTPSDYAKFLIEVIDPKPADALRLTRSSLKEMLRPQVMVVKTDEYSIWWGLGWRIARTKNGDLFGHGGENAGFQSISQVSAEQKSGFVIMTDGDNGAKLFEKLAPVFAQKLFLPSTS